MSYTFTPVTGGSIVFPDLWTARDYLRHCYRGMTIHGTSVNDGQQEFGKLRESDTPVYEVVTDLRGVEDNRKLWTLAYRNRRANKFHRVTNWSGTWHEAQAMSSRFGALRPELEVWFVPTRDAELMGYGAGEDEGNILVDSGRRVRMTETGELPVEILPTGGNDSDVGLQLTRYAIAKRTYVYGGDRDDRLTEANERLTAIGMDYLAADVESAMEELDAVLIATEGDVDTDTEYRLLGKVRRARKLLSLADPTFYAAL